MIAYAPCALVAADSFDALALVLQSDSEKPPLLLRRPRVSALDAPLRLLSRTLKVIPGEAGSCNVEEQPNFPTERILPTSKP